MLKKVLQLAGIFLAISLMAGCAGDAGKDGAAGAVGGKGDKGDIGNTGSSGPWPTPGPIGPEDDPTRAAAPAAYTAADGILGGAAYSKWWLTDAAGSVVKATENADLTADYGITQTANKDYYRCKACHAWDGFGNKGSYADRTGVSTQASSNRPDVADGTVFWMAKVMTYTQLYDAIAGVGGRAINTESNAHPDYSTLLTTAQIWNLVKFMKEEWIQPGVLYDLVIRGDPMYVDSTATLVKPALTPLNVGLGGTATAGDTIYTASCSACHGADGRTLDLGGRSAGEFIREKPWEGWFKAKFGEVGTSMGSGIVTTTSDMLDLYNALTDSTTYPDL